MSGYETICAIHSDIKWEIEQYLTSIQKKSVAFRQSDEFGKIKSIFILK